jgi:tripartite-type tricarboxylate transporter receptor subunit TctC
LPSALTAGDDNFATQEHIKARKLRFLAATTATRLEALPNVPTVGEFAPGYEAILWQGIRYALRELTGDDVDALLTLGTASPAARVAAEVERWLGQPALAS